MIVIKFSAQNTATIYPKAGSFYPNRLPEVKKNGDLPEILKLATRQSVLSGIETPSTCNACPG